MAILSDSFFLLSVSGIWRPITWKGWKARLYDLYTLIVTITIYTSLFSLLIDTLFSNVDSNTFSENLSLISGIIQVRQKISCAIFQRKFIIEIYERFNDYPCKPRDHEEAMIYERVKYIVRFIGKYYLAGFVVGMTWYSAIRIFLADPPLTLPHRGWLPYNVSTYRTYWLTTVYQSYAITNVGTATIMFDVMLFSTFSYICAHVNILRYRFIKIIKSLEEFYQHNVDREKQLNFERRVIADWVECHVEFIRLTKFVNATFSDVIFVECTSSSLVLCTLAYMLAKSDPHSMAYISHVLYFAQMLFQIFFLCIAGNQVTLEYDNIDITISEVNWVGLSYNMRKALIIILLQIRKPVQLDSGYFIVLSLILFKQVIKISYSIFGLLE